MTSDAIGVRLAGRGGQGVMLAGFLLAQAAMTDGMHVVQTQSYGPEARLGAAKSDVILSRSEIAYPEVIKPDVFLCLSHDAFVAYSSTVSDEATSIIDNRAVSGIDTPSAIILPLNRYRPRMWGRARHQHRRPRRPRRNRGSRLRAITARGPRRPRCA